MALICYQDGFILVGSVAGQRYWSTLIPPDVSGITSGVWTPDDQHVYLGTTQVIAFKIKPLKISQPLSVMRIFIQEILLLKIDRHFHNIHRCTCTYIEIVLKH